MILLPLPGTPSRPLEALLLRDTRISKLNYTLAGGPAPPQLLGAFTTSEGAMDTTVIYYFHVKGHGSSAARFFPNPDFENGYVFRFRRIAEGTTTGLGSGPTVTPLQLIPNPAAAGTELQLAVPTFFSDGSLRLVAADGRTVATTAFRAAAGSSVRLRVPSGLLPGMYVSQLVDQTGRVRSVGKVMVR